MAFGKIGEVILSVHGSCAQTFPVELGAVTSSGIGLELWSLSTWMGRACSSVVA